MSISVAVVVVVARFLPDSGIATLVVLYLLCTTPASLLRYVRSGSHLPFGLESFGAPQWALANSQS